MFDKILFKYILVGLVNTIIGYSLILTFFYVLNFTYSGAYMAGYIIAFFFSFILNRKIVFTSVGNKKEEFIKYVISFITAYTGSYLILLIVVEVFDANINISFLIGMITYSVMFYILNRYFTFKVIQGYIK